MSRGFTVALILVTLTIASQGVAVGVAGQSSSTAGSTNTTTAPLPTTEAPVATSPPTNGSTPTDASTATPSNATTATPTTPIPTSSPTAPTQLVVTMYTAAGCAENFPRTYETTAKQECVPWGFIDPNNPSRPTNEVWGGLDVHCSQNSFTAQLLEYNSSTPACGSPAKLVGSITTGIADNTCYSITPGGNHGNVIFSVQCFTASQPSVSCPIITANINQSFVYPNQTSVKTLPPMTFPSGYGTMKVQCENGTILYGNPYIKCDQHGWSTLPYCLQPGYCPPRSGPHRLFNIYAQSIAREPSIPTQPNGVVVDVFCEDGWYIDTGVSTDVNNNPKSMTCQNGVWSTFYPDCRAKIATIQCPKFQPLPHTITTETSGAPMQNRMYDVGSKLKSSCAANFSSTTGDEMITCQPNGQWSGNGVDDCKRMYCDKISPPPNGQFLPPQPTMIPIGSIFQVKCNPGYKLIQSAGTQIICEKKNDLDARFFAPPPQCIDDGSGQLSGNPNDTSDNSYPKRVAGGVIGGILGFALIIICVYCCCARRAKPAKFVSLGSEQHAKQTGEHTNDEMATMTGPQVETAEEI